MNSKDSFTYVAIIPIACSVLALVTLPIEEAAIVFQIAYFGTLSGIPIGIIGLVKRKNKTLSIIDIIIGSIYLLIGILVIALMIILLGGLIGAGTGFIEFLQGLAQIG